MVDEKSMTAVLCKSAADVCCIVVLHLPLKCLQCFVVLAGNLFAVLYTCLHAYWCGRGGMLLIG